MVNVQMMQFEMAKLREGNQRRVRHPHCPGWPRVDDIVGRIEDMISEKFSAAENSFLGEQRRVTALVEELRGAVQSVDGSNLERIGAEIRAQDGRDHGNDPTHVS